eukprot:COSAG06_NODE_6241_length_3015_cov_20.323288_5_plen_33_part_00
MEEGGPEVRAEMWGPIVTEASDEYYSSVRSAV